MASASTNGEIPKGNMWDLDQKLDQPMDEEAGRIRSMYREKKSSSLVILQLAFQSLGVAFGDLGTSPLYVFYNTFPHELKHEDDVVGALSLIIYSLTFIALLKYVVVVLRANDNGQGGTFALYSLLCRHANIKTIANQHHTDEELTTYSRWTFEEHSLAGKVKCWLESYAINKNVILFLVLIGTCMMIGDGILTPAISVLSAAGGIKLDHPKISNDVVILVAVVILVGLFSLQHYGIDRVSWLFATIVFLWFIIIGSIGAFNIWKYDSSVLKAFSPVFIFHFLKRGSHSWASLGGIMLSITGIEALFADLCHFPVLAIQLAFTLLVFPCLLLAYSGQAAYIMQNPGHVSDAFYRSIPEIVYWPVFIVATAAAIIASQATISATFSIIKQAVALGCFPRVKIVHTSKKFFGQIYIPSINWVLMVLCIAVTAGFKNKTQIGLAYGTAVVIDMMVTTLLMILIMLMVWRSNWVLVFSFASLSLTVELTYFSSVILKVDQGGWVPLVVAATLLIIMYVWHYGTMKRYEFEKHSKVSVAWILGLGPNLGLVRVPGIGFVYTELASGVPHIFSHLITNLPAIHSVVLFVCVKFLPVYTVPVEERVLVRRIGPKNFHMFRCIVRYGYKDLHKKDDDFEMMLFDSISIFVRLESKMDCSDSDEFSLDMGQQNTSKSITLNTTEDVESFTADSIVEITDSSILDSVDQYNNDVKAMTSHNGEEDELAFLNRCRDAGVVHILGNTTTKARRDSGFLKRVAIDYIYAFLRKICAENIAMLHVPHESTLKVGQVFYV
ncbi:potassium transporter 11 isoform X1 [Dendrobium catenatum]|uniref:potassium transporter 11 isoform X1 n=1 Tax=Dendrobium catenatum TaxID=906689 RepID=UPI0009F2139A|nr:potassium transporter 11 isoform X1 [Dendrobium catenatum]